MRASGLPCSSKAAGLKRTQSSQEIRGLSFVLAANFLPAVGGRVFYSAEKWEAETNRFILGSDICKQPPRGGSDGDGSGGSREPAPGGASRARADESEPG